LGKVLVEVNTRTLFGWKRLASERSVTASVFAQVLAEHAFSNCISCAWIDIRHKDRCS